MQCEKVRSDLRSRYGTRLPTQQCSKNAVIEASDGRNLCSKCFNTWYKKNYPEDTKTIKDSYKTTPANYFRFIKD